MSVVKLAASDDHVCALVSDGGVLCWGDDLYGQLGQPPEAGIVNPTPVVVAHLPAAKSIGAGWYHTCAVLLDGGIECWGRNNLGQLGPDAAPETPTPVRLPVPAAVSVAGGADHTCALLTSGQVWCWGYDQDGELGNGSSQTIGAPTPVDHLADAQAIALGAYESCALLASGAIACWGQNGSGDLGYDAGTYATLPGLVAW